MADKDFVVKNGLVVNTSVLVATGSNVGIGTASPDATLKVTGTANVTGNVKLSGATLNVTSNSSFTGNFIANSASFLIDTASGKIGIGTNNPDANLQIVGSANVSGDMRIGGNLTISGTTISVGNSTSTGDFLPTSNGYNLGNTTSRWGLFGNSAALTGTLAVTGNASLSANLSVTGGMYQGNSIANAVISGAQIQLSNATFTSFVTPNGLVVGNATINSTNFALSTTFVANTSSLSLGNSSVNTFANSSTIVVGNVTLNSTTLATYVNTSANYSFSGIHTHNVNVAIAANSTLLIGTTVVNSTSFTGTASNASLLNNKAEAALNVNSALTANAAAYLGSTIAAAYVQNTDSRTLSGNLSFTGTNTSILTNFRVVNSTANVLFVASNGNIGVANVSPVVKLHITGTDAILVPAGNTGQRPTGANGYLRYNTETAQFEGYANDAWGAIAGSGGAGGYYAKGGANTIGTSADANNIFRVNGQGLYNNTTIEATENALCAGPLTVQSGVTLLVSEGGRVVVS